MTAFTFRMPAGIEGEVNRIASATIEAQVVTPLGTTGAPAKYGTPMVVDNTGGNVGNMRALNTSDTAVYGFLVRPFPTVSSQDIVGVSTPPASGLIDILKRGYMSVRLQGPTAAVKGGTVYLWQGATDTSHLVVGGVEAATGTSVITMGASTYFMGPADSNGITEIGFNI